MNEWWVHGFNVWWGWLLNIGWDVPRCIMCKLFVEFVRCVIHKIITIQYKSYWQVTMKNHFCHLIHFLTERLIQEGNFFFTRCEKWLLFLIFIVPSRKKKNFQFMVYTKQYPKPCVFCVPYHVFYAIYSHPRSANT